MTTTIQTAPSGYGIRRTATCKGTSPLPGECYTTYFRYRMMTADEAKSLGSHAHVISHQGEIRNVKVNGATKTWKRDLTRVEVPLKYGLYEHFTDTAIDGTMQYLVVLLDEQGNPTTSEAKAEERD